MEINRESNCFMILKDHRENFAKNLMTRLVNSVGENQKG